MIARMGPPLGGMLVRMGSRRARSVYQIDCGAGKVEGAAHAAWPPDVVWLAHTRRARFRSDGCLRGGRGCFVLLLYRMQEHHL